MNYQVGDLFCAIWDENEMFLLTRISAVFSTTHGNEDVYIMCCMETHKSYEYRKEGIDSSFRKVA